MQTVAEKEAAATCATGVATTFGTVKAIGLTKPAAADATCTPSIERLSVPVAGGVVKNTCTCTPNVPLPLHACGVTTIFVITQALGCTAPAFAVAGVLCADNVAVRTQQHKVAAAHAVKTRKQSAREGNRRNIGKGRERQRREETRPPKEGTQREARHTSETTANVRFYFLT